MTTTSRICIAWVLALAGCETEPDTAAAHDHLVTEALTDVDLVNLGGTSAGGGLFAVSVGATGNGGRLTSWKVSTPDIAPAALGDSFVIPGANHQLHVLTSMLSPLLVHEMLVSASIVGTSLLVRSWRVADDGSFTQLDAVSYNPGGGGVADYAFGHRQISITPTSNRFQLVAPVVHAGAGAVRLVTWEIDGATGKITARTDSGDLVIGVAPDAQLAVSYVSGTARLRPHYAVSCLSGLGTIINSMWIVKDDGSSTLAGMYTSGKDIDNAAAVVRTAQSLASAPLGASGFVTVGNSTPSDPSPANAEVQVWEALACSASGGCIVPLNVSDSSFDLTPAIFGVQQAAPPVIIAPRAVAFDPVSGDELFAKNPQSMQSIASVRKVLVLIIALEAVAAGHVALDSIVTVSAAAANSAGSNMSLVAGEQISLRNLLYGMMMVSAGDATWAISEYVAGSVDGMVTRMNAKVKELDLKDTFYCHDADDFGFSSVGYSTARDQAAIWASVSADPTFLEIAGKARANICSTLPDQTSTCHPTPPALPSPLAGAMTKDMTQYVELDGWKGGNKGGTCKAYPLPICTDCLSAQATRLGRRIVSSSLRSVGVGAVWSDATKVLDYSYRQIFTPDFRGDSGGQAGAATDFGLAAMDVSFALTAVPKGVATIELCTWGVQPASGSLVRTMCASHAIAGLTAGGPATIPRRVGLATLLDPDAEADYVLGRITAGALKLAAWRVGQRY